MGRQACPKTGKKAAGIRERGNYLTNILKRPSGHHDESRQGMEEKQRPVQGPLDCQ